jgi:hypothetical protein
MNVRVFKAPTAMLFAAATLTAATAVSPLSRLPFASAGSGLGNSGDPCGPDNLGVLVDFNVPNDDGPQFAVATNGENAFVSVLQDTANQTFAVTYALLNQATALLPSGELSGPNGSQTWTQGLTSMGSTSTFDVSSIGTPTRFTMCMMGSGAVLISKVVNDEGGDFGFSVSCAGPSLNELVGGDLEISADYTQSDGIYFPGAPIGSTCTVTETYANGGGPYVNDGPQSVLVLQPFGAQVTITNTAVVSDLSVNASFPGSPVSATSSTVSYEVTVTNSGPDDRATIGVTNSLLYPLSIVDIVGDGQWTLYPPNGFEWFIPALAAGASATITLTLTAPLNVGLPYPVRPAIESCALLVFQAPDADVSNNRSCGVFARLPN